MTETLQPMADEVDRQRLAEQLLPQANALYDKHDPAGRTGGNSRNGSRSKTVLTEIGPVQIEVPRDTDASFDPQVVRKRQRRLTGGPIHKPSSVG